MRRGGLSNLCASRLRTIHFVSVLHVFIYSPEGSAVLSGHQGVRIAWAEDGTRNQTGREAVRGRLGEKGEQVGESIEGSGKDQGRQREIVSSLSLHSINSNVDSQTDLSLDPGTTLRNEMSIGTTTLGNAISGMSIGTIVSGNGIPGMDIGAMTSIPGMDIGTMTSGNGIPGMDIGTMTSGNGIPGMDIGTMTSGNEIPGIDTPTLTHTTVGLGAVTTSVATESTSSGDKHKQPGSTNIAAGETGVGAHIPLPASDIMSLSQCTSERTLNADEHISTADDPPLDEIVEDNPLEVKYSSPVDPPVFFTQENSSHHVPLPTDTLVSETQFLPVPGNGNETSSTREWDLSALASSLSQVNIDDSCTCTVPNTMFVFSTPKNRTLSSIAQRCSNVTLFTCRHIELQTSMNEETYWLA